MEKITKEKFVVKTKPWIFELIFKFNLRLKWFLNDLSVKSEKIKFKS